MHVIFIATNESISAVVWQADRDLVMAVVRLTSGALETRVCAADTLQEAVDEWTGLYLELYFVEVPDLPAELSHLGEARDRALQLPAVGYHALASTPHGRIRS